MREFDLINNLLKPLAGKNSQGLADDCAFFNGFCITKDVLVADVHFFPGDEPGKLAQKALRVNLSDLCASGAEPFGFMLGLALPRETEDAWLKAFAKGLKKDIEKFNFQMLGGDTVYHDGAIAISVTAIGKAKKPVKRSGAKIGDNIFVSGSVGGGFLGLMDKLEGVKKSKAISKYELPEPRVDLAKKLASIATAAIDISDGLLADLGHVCKESKVGAEIDSAKIPLFDKQSDLYLQITGGDDYELLFTSKKTSIPGCTKIGKIAKGSVIKLDGKQIEPAGFEHS